jgi:hypothetical protein
MKAKSSYLRSISGILVQRMRKSRGLVCLKIEATDPEIDASLSSCEEEKRR